MESQPKALPIVVPQPQQVPETRSQENSVPTPASKKRRASKACIHCHRSHISCEDGTIPVMLRPLTYLARPCSRCVHKGIPELCKDMKPTKRGRKSYLNPELCPSISNCVAVSQQPIKPAFSDCPSELQYLLSDCLPSGTKTATPYTQYLASK
jgi:hypothetical protein